MATLSILVTLLSQMIFSRWSPSFFGVTFKVDKFIDFVLILLSRKVRIALTLLLLLERFPNTLYYDCIRVLLVVIFSPSISKDVVSFFELSIF